VILRGTKPQVRAPARGAPNEPLNGSENGEASGLKPTTAISEFQIYERGVQVADYAMP
jgi:hypothetical protein